MRVFVATPLPFFKEGEPEDRFFSRDTGLLSRQLRAAGYESMVVMPGGPDVQQHPDVIRCSLKDMESGDWWTQFELDAVVLYAWMHPMYLKIAQAIHKSGIRLISRCDSVGLYDPRVNLVEYMRQEFYGYGSRILTKNNLQRAIRSVFKMAFRLMNRSYQVGIISFAGYCDEILIESTLAKERMQKFLRLYGHPDLTERVRYVPHPIDVSPDRVPVYEKEKLVIAVGRWDDYIKNGSLLIHILIRVLKEHPDYRAVIIGPGFQSLEERVQADGMKDFIQFTGRIPHNEVLLWMRRAQIFLVTSRYESFNMAAAEASACGASVVGSRHLPSISDFVSQRSGTLARRYTVGSISDAVRYEISQWRSGCRRGECCGQLRCSFG